MKRFLVVLSLVFSLVACDTDTVTKSNEEADKLKVATTIYPITFLVEQIGKDYVAVESIISNGADAHSYEPTIAQLTYANDADLFFYVDENIESFMMKMYANIEKGNAKIISLAKALDIEIEEHDHDSTNETTEESESAHNEDGEHDDENDHGHEFHHHEDFHIWLNPMDMQAMAQVVLNELIHKLPTYEKELTANYDVLSGKLLELHEAFMELQTSPNPYFMVAHAAYGSWETYGIHQIPITGVLGNDEPTQKELISFIEQGKEYNLSYIFYEQNIPSANGKVIEKELGLTPLNLNNLATLTNQQAKAGEDYFSLMYENIEMLRKEIDE